MELVCPAGNLQSLKAAVDAGANSVYIGFRDETNARHFPGLNFNDRQITEGMQYAHTRGVRVFITINSYPQPGNLKKWQHAVDSAANLGADALLLADIGIMDYAAETWPDLNLHLSVQGSATSQDAIAFYAQQFGIKRAVLPRVLSIRQVAAIAEEEPGTDRDIRLSAACASWSRAVVYLSSYVTGQGPEYVWGLLTREFRAMVWKRVTARKPG